MVDADCAKCHTSCGQCHISRPNAVRGGLVSGHMFKNPPNQTENCTACHGSRIGEEFRGSHDGIPADAHYNMGMNCFSCHTADEIHGTGETPPHRYDVENGPKCETCHPDVLTDTQNSQHSIHTDDVQCQVCHSVSYKTCYNCHVGSGLQDPSRLDFRIGLNYERDDLHPWKYIVVRHIPIAPDSYEEYGIDMPHYASFPTWEMATPHNIRKNTPQNESCGACHGNEDIFLTPAYIDSLIAEGLMHTEEIEANADVVVEQLPSMGLPTAGSE